VALVNALKWHKGFGDRALERMFAREAGLHRRGGLLRCQYQSFAQFYGWPRLWRPTVRRIDLALLAGNAVLLSCRYPVGGGTTAGHLFLLSCRTAKSFFAVNLEGRRSWRRKRSFRRLWLKKYYQRYPAAWIVAPHRGGKDELAA
jgi:hypothetical protein